MNSETAYLALLFDAPLQSWGYQSKFDRRTSFSQPTRSGILGMICAAIGIDRVDSAGLAEFADTVITVYTLRNGDRLTDFHTVGGGWGKNKKEEKLNIVPKAGGGAGNTVVTRREYLQHAKFGVVIWGTRSRLMEIEAAFQNPAWGVWLGRKSCIPAAPVAQGVFDSPETAKERLCQCAGIDSPVRTCREVASFEEGTDTLMDIPLDFGKREFAPRRIQVI